MAISPLTNRDGDKEKGARMAEIMEVVEVPAVVGDSNTGDNIEDEQGVTLALPETGSFVTTDVIPDLNEIEWKLRLRPVNLQLPFLHMPRRGNNAPNTI